MLFAWLVAGFLLCSGRAEASWAAPVTVMSTPSDVVVPYFVQSPERSRTALAVSGASLSVIPLGVRGFGVPLHPPVRNEPLGEEIAINERGAIAVAWNAYVPQEPADYRGECWCKVRAVMGGADGAFQRPRTLSRAGDNPDYAVALTRQGRATVFWQLASGPLRASEAAGGTFASARTVAPDARGFALDTLADGSPLLLLQRPGDWSAATRPYTHTRSIGQLPEDASFAGGAFGQTVLTSDGHGNELAVAAATDTGQITVAHRRANGLFSQFRTLPTNTRGADCDFHAAMSRHGALIAWSCAPTGDPHGWGQAAALTPSGRVLSVSHRHGVYDAGSPPELAIDSGGHAIASWLDYSDKGFITLTSTRGRFGIFRHLARNTYSALNQPPPLTIRHNVAYATWPQDAGRNRQSIRVAQLKLPR